VQRIRDDQVQVGYSMIGRSRCQMMSCVICIMHKETRSVDFLVEPQNQDRKFPSFNLKTSSFGLVIWVSKSLWWFLDLGLKTKRTMVCRLHHKTDRMRTARDTR
jgi:hypothetical protein